MRKDVKFGLTIGAILVVTLVIYVIVLSRGSGTPQHLSLVMPNQSDQNATESTDPADSSSANHTDPAATAAPGPDDLDNTSGTTPAPSANAPIPPAPSSSVPATQPAASTTGNDWEHALNSGVPMTMAAPEHTVTPSIDSSSSPAIRNNVSAPANIPMIDSLPSTQPSRPMMADVPTLDAAPAPTSIPNTSGNTPRTHRVAEGESPYSISQAVYGSGKYYTKIIAANPGINPRRLKVGQILVIPQLTDTDKPATPAASNSAAAPRVNTKTAYVVVSGDSLETISMKLYGTRSNDMIEQLYTANRSLIGPDQDVLKIGWILKLPQPPTQSDAQR